MGRLARWKHWIVFLLLAPLASLAAYHLGSLAALGSRQGQRAPLPTANGLYIEPTALDLGEVWETPRHTFRLTIQNLGRESRTVSRFETTCGCLKLDPPGQTIAPGEKAEFTAHLDLMYRPPHQWGVGRRPISVRLNPVFEGDLVGTPGWDVKGVVLTRISLNTPTLAFADQCSHGGPRVSRKVHIKAHVPLQTLRTSVVPNYAQVRIESSAAGPRDYFLFVSPNPCLPIGRFHFEVRLQAVTLDGMSHPCPTIEVSGEMQPAARVIPRMVLLGEHNVSSMAEADVTLRLPGKDWKIDHLEVDTTGVLVTQGKADMENAVPLHITQQIKEIGDHVSLIRVVVRKPDKEVEIVPVEVWYYGRSGSRE